MMKIFNKPGFEFIFAIALIVILGLPALVFAQSQKNIEIQINNGDTTVNGKNIKKMNAAERKDALDAINDVPPPPPIPGVRGGSNSKVIIKKRISGDNKADVLIERAAPGDGPAIASFDSDHKDVKVRLRKLRGADSAQAFTYRFDKDLPPLEPNTFRTNGPNRRPSLMRDKYNQVFTYSNTDNDGISTNISFRVVDASAEKLKAIADVEKAQLVVNDLSIVPEFSTGKTTISFTLPAKSVANVLLTNSQGNVLWADKAIAGSFRKKVSLPLNGVYYLQVKQGANVSVKKIIKE